MLRHVKTFFSSLVECRFDFRRAVSKIHVLTAYWYCLPATDWEPYYSDMRVYPTVYNYIVVFRPNLGVSYPFLTPEPNGIAEGVYSIGRVLRRRRNAVSVWQGRVVTKYFNFVTILRYFFEYFMK